MKENKCFNIHTINLLKTDAAPEGLFRSSMDGRDEDATPLCSHSFVHVCMVVEGSGVHRVFDQAIPCRAGDIFLAPPDTPHSFFVPDNGEKMTVEQLLFDVGDWFEGELTAVGDSRFCYGVFSDNSVIAYAMLNEQMQKEVHRLFDSIEGELSEKRQDWQDALRANLTQLLISLGRYINCSIKNDTPVSSKEWSLVLSVMRVAKERAMDCKFTLKAVADAFYISPSHLSRIFKGLTGQLFSEYLRDIRIDHACRLLRDTALTVEEIVELCGLQDIPSFYHNFNARMHMTPRQYRQMIAEKKDTSQSEDRIFNEISEQLQRGAAGAVKKLVQQALDAGCTPTDVLNRGLLAGMRVVGEKFKSSQVYVPEVLVSARAMNAGMQMLKPFLAKDSMGVSGRVCIGTVQGDLHDIGKNLVRMMMEGRGLEVIDLGTDVAPEAFIQAVTEQNCRVICCSALLTTTMSVMEDVVKAAEQAGIRDRVMIMIGGAPVTEKYCRSIGADCYTEDAASAADAAVEFFRKNP